MQDLEGLDEHLLGALTHLYDPDYEPTPEVYALVGCDVEGGALPVQSALMKAIEALESREDLPASAHLWRVYEVLHKRFVLKLTQERTAESLNISVRHLNRVQREAIHTLARRLWESQRAGRTDRGGTSDLSSSQSMDSLFQASDWRAQTQRELASLRASAPDAVSDVGETIEGILDLQTALNSDHPFEAKVGFVQPHLLARVHLSVLRQILITAIRRLERLHPSGPVTIFAGLENGNVKITLASSVASAGGQVEPEIVRDILTPEGVSVEVQAEEEYVFVWIRVPSAGGKVTVLVVDDNADMAHFYRRCTAGTRYHIVDISDGEDMMAVIDEVTPQVIVLDVMLPGVDGWQLLMRLHEDPATRPIPVIVCTVVREEELALSLGAAHYLSKPVRPREFIQALDRVLSQVPATT